MPSTNGSTGVAAPVNQSERIIILDSIRSLAGLGIQLMNIPAFGLPHSAIFDYSINKQSDLKCPPKWNWHREILKVVI
jgi:uncharacterized protein